MPDRKLIDCQNCKYWNFDMDMNAFCTHENAGVYGTTINAFRSERKLNYTRGPNCGPDAKYFEQGNHSFASKEINL